MSPSTLNRGVCESTNSSVNICILSMLYLFASHDSYIELHSSPSIGKMLEVGECREDFKSSIYIVC